MKRHASALLMLAVGACTYNEYKNYYSPVTSDPDASVPDVTGAGGARQGSAGSTANVAGSGSAGEGGSALTGNGGGQGAGEGCTGCVRISVLPGRVAEYQLELDPRRNLTNSIVSFRVRVQYVDDLDLAVYVESGDHIDGQLGQEGAVAGARLRSDLGWQDVGIDLSQVEPFRAPSLNDGDGGFAGGGFDPGQPFDKSRAQRVGLNIAVSQRGGLLTPAEIEIDALTFSSPSSLNLDFSADQGGLELVDPDSASLTHIPE